MDCTPPALLQLLPAPKVRKDAKDLPLQNRPRNGGQNPPGCADAAAEDGRRCSNVYEVNTWLWQFGRGKPRRGGLTIVETFDRKEAARKAWTSVGRRIVSVARVIVPDGK